MQKIIYFLFVGLLVLSSTAYADGKKIVKWVDSKGVTHYGDKLPAQEAGRNSSEMNNQGMVIKHNVVADNKNDASDQEKFEQERKDKILLASYTKAEEIDLARDRNLQMDQASLQALTQQKINITNRTVRNNKSAENFKARKKPLPPYLVEELKLSKIETDNINKQLTQRKLSMEATKTHYAEEKARFIALKQPALGDSPAATPQETTPATNAPSNAAPTKTTAAKPK
jgi:Domain of unknown function (DUF4124)